MSAALTCPVELPTGSEIDAAHAELLSLARQINEWRVTLGLSDRRLLDRFPGIRSTKAFSAFRDGRVQIADVAGYLVNYRGVLVQIQHEAADQAQEPLYPDLSPAEAVMAAALSVMRSVGRERLVLVEGHSGAGKSRSLELLASAHPATVVLAEADDSWARLAAALAGLLEAMGVPPSDHARSVSGRIAQLIGKLRERRVMLAIDEAHHMGAAALNICKSIINRTDGWVLLATIPTLWRKLSSSAAEEARQLLHNRLHQRVRLGAPDRADAERVLARRLSLSPDGLPSAKALALLTDAAADLGHQAFLRRVVGQVLAAGAAPAGALEDAALIEAIRAAKHEIL